MMEPNNVSNKDLCCACGTCYSICPVNAIDFKLETREYKPIVNDKCISCGKCIEVCPFNKPIIKDDSLLGKYVGLFHAKSKDKKILDSATSGGIISTLLSHLIENNYIDYAILVDYDSKRRIIAKAVIAKNTKDVIMCMGSKYQQVLINRLLTEVKETDRVAIVGLPCHLKALDNYIKMNMLNEMNKLNENNIYKIGLFCGHILNLNHLDYLLKKLNIKEEEIKSFGYRVEGWPGKLLFETDKKRLLFPFSYFSSLLSARFFTPKACLFCDDLTGEYSDISCGDAWNISKEKSSIVIVRNKKMLNILNKLKHKILLHPISDKDIIRSQGSQLSFKKKNIFARVKLHNLFSRNKIAYESHKIKSSFIDYIGAILLFLNRLVSVKVLLIMPPFLLRWYSKIVSYSTGFYYKRIINKFKFKGLIK